MNLSLDLTDVQSQARSAQAAIETAVARFEQWMAVPDSPIRAIKHLPAREGQFVEMPGEIAVSLRQALAKRGITRLYTHQAEAFDHAQGNRNAVIVTPTASGKTLCYNLPVLNRLLNDPAARAMYLFPTKALAEDQLQEFNAAVEAMGSDIRAFTYDGDTPQDARRAIRERANVIGDGRGKVVGTGGCVRGPVYWR